MDPLFDGAFLAGFECSCHELENGRRLDLAVSTRHDVFARADYRRLASVGMTACRDGVSWVRAEMRAGAFDFSATLPLLRASEEFGIQVIWDLLHFGWPGDIDVFSVGFPRRFARYAAAFARWLRQESERPALVTPINEISFLSWAGGDVRCMNPFASARGVELKVQLVRATLDAIDAIRAVLPETRFLQPEPVINIVPDPALPKTWRRVEADNELQYQTWDMLTGRVWPALGGHERYLDIVGVNFYPDNQFMLDGTTVPLGDARYKPFSDMLVQVSRRYGRPLIVSETGAEGERRAPWLRYVVHECITALGMDVELHGVTLYPIVDHPGWTDDRHCDNGLWGYPTQNGGRDPHVPLLEEVRHMAPHLHGARGAMLERRERLQATA